MAILTSYEGSNNDYENSGTGADYAQGFKIPNNASVVSASIYGSKGNSSSGTFALEIYSGADPGDTLVKTETFNSSILTAYGSPAWNEITWTTPVDLVGGTQYYLRFVAVTGSANDELRWSTDTTSPSYADGSAWVDSGSWTAQSTRDKNFRINGVEDVGLSINDAITVTDIKEVALAFYLRPSTGVGLNVWPK